MICIKDGTSSVWVEFYQVFLNILAKTNISVKYWILILMVFNAISWTYMYILILRKSARKVAIDLPIIQRFPCSWDLNETSLIGVRVQQGPFFYYEMVFIAGKHLKKCYNFKIKWRIIATNGIQLARLNDVNHTNVN